jgi:hypothetical protein
MTVAACKAAPFGRRQNLYRSAKALDRRKNHRLAQSLPKIGQGLGMSEPKRPRIPALGLDPPYAQKALSLNTMISDGLSGRFR